MKIRTPARRLAPLRFSRHRPPMGGVLLFVYMFVLCSSCLMFLLRAPFFRWGVLISAMSPLPSPSPQNKASYGQFSQCRLEGLESQNHCLLSLQTCPLKVKISQGLGTSFQIELLKTGHRHTSRGPQGRMQAEQFRCGQKGPALFSAKAIALRPISLLRTISTKIA